MSGPHKVDELVAQTAAFAELQAEKLRFDELFKQREQDEVAKMKEAAHRINYSIVPNGHRSRGRKRKDGDQT